METKSSNLSVLLEEGVKRGRVKMDIETEIRYRTQNLRFNKILMKRKLVEICILVSL